jgi:uncharacterized protein (TIGR02646 family)
MARFTRTQPAPPVKGDYRAYRPFVRNDFDKCCAYCLMAELFAAGEANFELDHFRPKTRFSEQTNDFYNLYYSCHPCNHIKSAKWPPSPLIQQGIGFVDLCNDDFETHFIEQADGRWEGITPSAKYTIDALYLNRAHLIELRLCLRQLKAQ